MKIKNCYTLGSQYDNNSLVVITQDDKEYRIKATEILKLLKGQKFKQRKARKHIYLEVQE